MSFVNLVICLETSFLMPLYRVPNGLFRAEGTMKNVNTIEDYRKLDRAKILNQAGRTVYLASL